MTEAEFVEYYATNSQVPKEDILQHYVPLPCVCGDEECQGWAMIPNNAISIAAHKQLYGPKP